MMTRNTDHEWGSVTKALHWSIGLLILINVGIAYWISTLEEDVPGDPETWLVLTPLHKSIGITALALILIRLGWTVTGTRPDLQPGIPVWQRNLTHGIHSLLYILMLLVPLMGYATSAAFGSPFEYFGLFVVPNLVPENETTVTVTYWIHFVSAWMMAGLVALHAAAAIWHHLVPRDDTLLRMLPERLAAWMRQPVTDD